MLEVSMIFSFDMLTMPTVSIILTTFNRAYILEKSIQSVLNQTYRDFELIIVDDGSSDKTQELVASFNDSRILFVRHKENRGLAVSRNTGLGLVKGKYIGFQDSDDLWMPNKLERQVPLIHNAPEEIGVVYSQLEKVLKNGRKIILPPSQNQHTSGNLLEELLKENFITMQVALLKREIISKVGKFDEDLNWLEDWDFWIRVAKQFKFLYAPFIAVQATILEDSLTSNRLNRLNARARTFQKHQETFINHPKIYSAVAYKIGKGYLFQSDTHLGRKYLFGAWKNAPLNLKYLIVALLSLFGSRVFERIARMIG